MLSSSPAACDLSPTSAPCPPASSASHSAQWLQPPAATAEKPRIHPTPGPPEPALAGARRRCCCTARAAAAVTAAAAAATAIATAAAATAAAAAAVAAAAAAAAATAQQLRYPSCCYPSCCYPSCCYRRAAEQRRSRRTRRCSAQGRRLVRACGPAPRACRPPSCRRKTPAPSHGKRRLEHRLLLDPTTAFP